MRDVRESRRTPATRRSQQRHGLADVVLNLLTRLPQLLPELDRRQLGQIVTVVEAVRLDRHAGLRHLAQR